MKKLYCTIICLLIGTTFTHAQDYDLNQYKYRYQLYKGLTTNFSFDNNGSSIFQTTNSSGTGNSFDNSTDNDARLVASVSFFSDINTEDKQESIRANSALDLQAQYTGTNSQGVGNRDGSIYGIYHGFRNEHSRTYTNNTFKYSAKKISIYNSINRTKQNPRNLTEQYTTQARYFYNMLSLQGELAWGKGTGRLDQVTDAVSSYFLLEDLKQKLGNDYTNEQLEKVAVGITTIRSKRYLDSRLGTIEQVEMLDSVLNASGISSSNNNAAYYTTLNDNWLYAQQRTRQTGKRLTKSFRLQGTAFSSYTTSQKHSKQELDTSEVTTYSKTILNIQLIDPSFNYQYEDYKQLSLFIQRSTDFGASISTSINVFHHRSDVSEDDYPKAERIFDPITFITIRPMVYGSWGYIYQYNSRNFVEWNTRVSSRITNIIGSDIHILDLNTKSVDLNITSTLDYYHWFTPQLAVRASGSVQYGNQSNGLDIINPSYFNRTNTIYHNLSAGIVYQIY